MLDHIKSFLFKAEAEVPQSDVVPAAAAALLIESALLDGDFDETERATIANLLAMRFGLAADAVAALIEEGERAAEQSVELYSITRTLKDNLGHDERLEIMEMLWQVVLADGEVHDFEANLVRRVAGLLHVPDKEAGLARKKALERLDFAPGAA